MFQLLRQLRSNQWHPFLIHSNMLKAPPAVEVISAVAVDRADRTAEASTRASQAIPILATPISARQSLAFGSAERITSSEAEGRSGSVTRGAPSIPSFHSFCSSTLLQRRATRSAPEGVHPILNWPNAISGARLLSGPAIAYLIMHGQWAGAFVALGLSGLSDWLDGFVARRFHQSSVVGSYLDPLADKVLIGCTAGALAYEGSLYPPLAVLIIGRDIFLVSGAFVLRLRDFGWRWPGWREYFRTIPTPLTGMSQSKLLYPDKGSNEGSAHGKTSAKNDTQPEFLQDDKDTDRSRSGNEGVGPAPFVEPLYVSKLNTVAQLGLFAGCITASWYNWPPEPVLLGLGGITGALTLASWHAYWRQNRK